MRDLNRLDVKAVKQHSLEIQRAEAEGKTIPDKRFSGVCLIKNYSAGTTSTGKPKFSGILANKDEVDFNVWSNAGAFITLSEAEIKPGETLGEVNGAVSKFGFCLDSINIIDKGIDPSGFLTYKYDRKTMKTSFFQSLADCGLTDEGRKMLMGVYKSDKDVNSRFSREFAALSHHDNCQSGLIAHTMKCLKIYNGIKGEYKFLSDKRINDLMVIGLALHDVGKVYEMENGTYQRYSYLTHRSLGVEFLVRCKQLICDTYDEDFFYLLLSIIEQHHDEYGDKARTIYAYLAHMVDNMEATCTSLDEMIGNEEYTDDMSGRKLRFNGAYYNL